MFVTIFYECKDNLYIIILPKKSVLSLNTNLKVFAFIGFVKLKICIVFLSSG